MAAGHATIEVTAIDTRVVAHTLPVLLLVAALPFPTSVLANHGPWLLLLLAVSGLVPSVLRARRAA